MTLFTRSALDVFNPVSADGSPRGADMPETMIWGIEVERVVNGVAASGGALIFNLRQVLLASLGYPVNAMAWVVGDPTPAYNGIYLKTAASGLGTWTRVGDLPFQVITLSVGGSANALVATSQLPIPAADRAALLIFNTPLANTGPATMAVNGEAALPVLDRYGNALTENFFASGGAAIAVKSNGAFRTFLDTDAAVARAAAEAARDAAVTAKDQAVSARNETVFARDDVRQKWLGEYDFYPEAVDTGFAIIDGSAFSLVDQPDPGDDGIYVRRGGAWQPIGVLPGAFARRGFIFVDAGMAASGVVPIAGGYVPGQTDFYRNGALQVPGATAGTGVLDADIVALDGATVTFPDGVLQSDPPDVIRWTAYSPFNPAVMPAADSEFAPIGPLTSLNVQGAIEQLLALLASFAPLFSPVLTGEPKAPTAAPGTSSTQLATTKFVSDAIAAIPPSASAPLPSGHLAGFGMANNAVDASNDIDFAAGTARNSADTLNIIIAAGMTKRLDAVWAAGTDQGGLDTGAKANSTWYHCFAICKADGTAGDFLLSLSATAPTLPATYTVFRRIGSIRTNAAGAILGFLQYGDLFAWNEVQLDLNSVMVGTLAQVTLTVPPIAGIIANVQGLVAHATLNPGVYVNRVGLAANANAPTARVAGSVLHGYSTCVPVNGAGQVDVGADNPNTTVTIGTVSYIDSRGRN